MKEEVYAELSTMSAEQLRLLLKILKGEVSPPQT